MLFCPYHVDKNASFEVCLKSGEHYGKYFCFSCGRAGTLTKGMMEILEQQKTKKKSQDRRTNSVDWESLVQLYKENINIIGPYGLGIEWDVSDLILDNLTIGFDGEAWTFPMRNEYNEIIGIQRRFPDGFKCAIEGSRNGLFVPIPIPYPSVYFITEGVSDLAALLDLGYYGIARPNYNSCNDMVDEWLRINLSDEILYYKVFIIADNDAPGFTGAKQLANRTGISEGNIIVPSEKDLRKTVEVNGKDNTIKFLKGWL